LRAASLPAVRRDGEDLVLELRVQPRAATSGFAGQFGDRLRIRLQAPPVDGRANEALVEFLARALGVPKSAVVIERGLTGRDKRVRIRGPGRPLPGPLASLLGEG
jgi:uncharacterized protein (TIGR00251 family)